MLVSHRQYELHLEQAGLSKIVFTLSMLGNNHPKCSCHSISCLPNASLEKSFIPPPLATPPYVVPFQLVSNYLCDPTPDTSYWLLGSLSPSHPARSQWHRHWRFLSFELLPSIERNHKEYLETCKHWAKQSTLLHPQTSWDDGCPVDVAKQMSC